MLDEQRAFAPFLSGRSIFSIHFMEWNDSRGLYRKLKRQSVGDYRLNASKTKVAIWGITCKTSQPKTRTAPKNAYNAKPLSSLTADDKPLHFLLFRIHET
jgi:hypothetical protein